MRLTDLKWLHDRTRANAVSGCMEWTGYSNRGGYGQIELDGRIWLAHRAVWAALRGPIPPGMLVLHHCDNPRCVNVEHLFLGTHADNAADARAKGRWYPIDPAHTRKRRIRKLTDEQVRAIRIDARKHVDIASEYGVARSIVSEIKSGKRKRLVA